MIESHQVKTELQQLIQNPDKDLNLNGSYPNRPLFSVRIIYLRYKISS